MSSAFLQGKVPPLDECLHCGRCEVECPVGIDVPTLVWKTQIDYAQKTRKEPEEEAAG